MCCLPPRRPRRRARSCQPTGDPSGSGACLDSGQCSLRQAVAAASSGDTIQLPAGTYSLTLGTDIDITKSLTIEGDTTADTTIDGSQNTSARILRIDDASVTIEKLTLTGGADGADEFPCGNPCYTYELNGGGALWNNGGTVNITDVAFANNPGGAAPGVVSNTGGTLTMTDVSFTDDQAGLGGALFTHSGTVVGERCHLRGQLDRLLQRRRDLPSRRNRVVDELHRGRERRVGLDRRRDPQRRARLTLTNDTLSGNVRGSLMTDPGPPRRLSRTRSSPMGSPKAATATASHRDSRMTGTARAAPPR